MNGDRMMKLSLILCTAMTLSNVAYAAAPKYDADLLKETDAFLKGIDNALVERGDGFDLKRRADHSKWALDLKKRAEVFLGDGSDSDKMQSPFRPCYNAVHWAGEIWSSKMAQHREASKFNYDSVQRWTKEYKSERKYCSPKRRGQL